MFSADRRFILLSILILVLLVGIGFTARQSQAGRKKIDPHKIVILFTGDDRGQCKPVCT